MGILNYSTTINATKTAGEVQAALAKHGAQRVAVMYESGQPLAIAFAINTEFGLRSFELPANAEGVYKAVCSDRTMPPRYKDRAQSQRIAWRILKDWIEVQLAIIEAGMMRLDEVMLPYMVADNGRTVAVNYRAGSALAIEGAS